LVLLALVGCSDHAKPAKDAIMLRLKDPSSVEWRDVTYFVSGKIVDVCGSFNAKNTFGAYTGYKRFYYRSGFLVIEGEADTSLWNACPKQSVVI
jgi:hypothetical protein